MTTERDPATVEKALKLRANVKKKKPSFVRPESWRYDRLAENWRRPRGLDNKMRRKIKGWPQTVNTGYRGPKIARGLHPSGFKEVLVYNDEHLKEIDPDAQAIRIGHTVGRRKRARILAEARKRKITVLNLKEVREAAKEAEEKETAEEAAVEEKGEEEKAEAETPKQEKPKKKRKGKGEKQ